MLAGDPTVPAVQTAETFTCPEFSHRTRKRALGRFRDEIFDILVIGGGITGAGVARDAARRGLSVALVEKSDFASGTSSRSSKLIHGGLRYLESLEFHLVFEALSERACLLRTAPNLVRPLKFYFPFYRGDLHGPMVLRCGMWLYDLLSLFRAPGFHQSLSKRRLLEEVPFLSAEGLRGGFSYYDASMCDDAFVIEILRSARQGGAAVANYVEAVEPLWDRDRVIGYRVRDLDPLGHARPDAIADAFCDLRARHVIVCAGPWTDRLGSALSPEWHTWLNPSKGVHLVFDLKRIPLQGALVMSHPEDGRISFVIPRPDLGAGVVIVGTTDGPAPKEPSRVSVDAEDVGYLMGLLNRYFPELKLSTSDILSSYAGIRPLVGGGASQLQKVSREHHIGVGPGGVTVIAGGKYTTYRKMAEEAVEFALKHWKREARAGGAPAFPQGLRPARTREPVNHAAVPVEVARARLAAAARGMAVPEELFARYGSDALEIRSWSRSVPEVPWPDGFPDLGGQLVFAMRHGLTLRLRDFYLRRVPLYASRADHGLPWVEELATIWAQELGAGAREREAELADLKSSMP